MDFAEKNGLPVTTVVSIVEPRRKISQAPASSHDSYTVKM